MEAPIEILNGINWEYVGIAIGIVSLAIGVIGVILAIIFYRRSRKKASLAYEILTQTRLLTVSEELDNAVEILFNGVPVKNVHLTRVRITNSGDEPFTESDFIKPIEVSFAKGVEILSSDVVEITPESLNLRIIRVGNIKIQIVPELLNQGESFTVKLITSRDGDVSSEGLDVSARIVGVKEVEEDISGKADRGLMIILGPFLVLVLLFAFNVILVFLPGGSVFGITTTIVTWFALVYSVLYIILFVGAVFLSWLRERRGMKSE